MSQTEWVSIINSPKDGEPANQQTFERSISQLARRTEYLRQIVDDYSLRGGRISLFAVKTYADVEVGDVVYYDPSSDSYGKALAEGDIDPNTNTYSASPRAFACGICVRKNGALSGDILCAGFSNLLKDWGINPSNLFDRPATYSNAGTRGYLSSLTPGKLTSHPSSPLIQIGVFSDELSQIWPLQKDIFESHLHYRFKLSWVPGSSQNHDGTGVGSFNGKLFVDHSSTPRGTGDDMPGLLLSFKRNYEPTQISETNPIRVEFKKITSPSNKIRVRIFSGIDLDREDNTSGSVFNDFFIDNDDPNDPKEYGKWIKIPAPNAEFPNAGFSVAFLRADRDYLSHPSLWDDLFNNDDLISVTDEFKVFVPHDLVGWGNANHFETSELNAFRLGHEYITNLDAVWPPTPVSSVELVTNGVSRIRDEEFTADESGIYWKRAASVPWHWDGLNALLYFTKSTLENSRSVVLSLSSQSNMLKFVDCFSGKESSTGHLKAQFNLSLNEEVNITDGVYTTLASINPITNKFKRSHIVTELVAGPGISIAKMQSTGTIDKNIGKLMISSVNVKLEGSLDVVSLINAKEDFLNEIVPCIFFLPPSNGRCRMVSRVVIPSKDLIGVTPSLKLFAQPIGYGSTSSSVVTFSVSSFVVNEGTSIDSLSLASPDLYREFSVDLLSYSAKTVLPIKEIDLGELGIGDQVYSVWERKSSITSPVATDNYGHDFGFTQVRWEITLL